MSREHTLPSQDVVTVAPVQQNPLQTQFQSRPFAVQAKASANSTQEQSADKTEAEVDRTDELGHKLANISFASASPEPPKLPNQLKLKAALRTNALQAKLAIGEPNDRYEQEADRVAEQVISQMNEFAIAQQQTQEGENPLQMKPCVTQLQREQFRIAQLKRMGIGGGDASPDIESSINSAKGNGQKLPNLLRLKMENVMGVDFSGVNIHTDANVDVLNRSLNARGFTTGQDIFFKQGEYNPNSTEGQKLIAHESTHVVQQMGSFAKRVQREGENKSTSTTKAFDPLKAQADIEEFKKRVSRFPSINQPEFISLIEDYVNLAGKNDEAGAQAKIEAIILFMDKLHAFEIDKKTYIKMEKDGKLNPETAQRIANERTSRTVFWSKLETLFPIETANEMGGITLEGSVAGSLFNGLNFGMDYNSHAILRNQWKIVSESFAAHMHGVVHAQVFEKIHPKSVLTTTEWDKINGFLKDGRVTEFVVHFFKYESGELKEFQQNSVRPPNHEAQWKQLPWFQEGSDEEKEWAARQQNVREGEQKRIKQVDEADKTERENDIEFYKEKAATKERFKNAKAFFEKLEKDKK